MAVGTQHIALIDLFQDSLAAPTFQRSFSDADVFLVGVSVMKIEAGWIVLWTPAALNFQRPDPIECRSFSRSNLRETKDAILLVIRSDVSTASVSILVGHARF